MARIGKIARLPRPVREELNHRIENGEPGSMVLKWLNSLPAVRCTLDMSFGGRPVSAQNLSEWRQGGFRDWQATQETRAMARSFLAEAEELEDEVGDTPFTDRLTETIALGLARLLREACKADAGSVRVADVLGISRELARLRSGDHRMRKLLIERERIEEEREKARRAEMEAMQLQIEQANRKTRIHGELLRKRYCDGIADGSLPPDREASIRQFFRDWAEHLGECGVPPLPQACDHHPIPQAKSK